MALSCLHRSPRSAGLTLPYDSSPASSAELQQAEKLLTTKNGASDPAFHHSNCQANWLKPALSKLLCPPLFYPSNPAVPLTPLHLTATWIHREAERVTEHETETLDQNSNGAWLSQARKQTCLLESLAHTDLTSWSRVHVLFDKLQL